jgi:4-amino-4-deoxychorismate lyase
MSRLIESVKLLNGQLFNLAYHEQRMNRAFETFYGSDRRISLQTILAQYSYPKSGLYKCRILYNDLTLEVNFTPYIPKTISRVKVIDDDEISYSYKFEDRREIESLFDLRQDCDDILIIKEGKVGDCSFSNIVFKKGDTWFTPASCLLRGTMRQKLLDEKKIFELDISKNDIRSYETFKIINAMLEFDSPEVVVSNIVF